MGFHKESHVKQVWCPKQWGFRNIVMLEICFAGLILVDENWIMLEIKANNLGIIELLILVIIHVLSHTGVFD